MGFNTFRWLQPYCEACRLSYFLIFSLLKIYTSLQTINEHCALLAVAPIGSILSCADFFCGAPGVFEA